MVSNKPLYPKTDTEFRAIGTDKRTFHRVIKPEILKQTRNSYPESGNNPDIGIDRKGKIWLKNQRNNKEIETDLSFDSFCAD